MYEYDVYRDRIEDNTKYTDQAWIYTKKIYHLTRPNLFRSDKTTGNFFQKIFTRDKRYIYSIRIITKLSKLYYH